MLRPDSPLTRESVIYTLKLACIPSRASVGIQLLSESLQYSPPAFVRAGSEGDTHLRYPSWINPLLERTRVSVFISSNLILSTAISEGIRIPDTNLSAEMINEIAEN